VMKLFEMIVIQVSEKSRAANRMRGDFEIVNVTIPVVTDIVDGSGRRR